MDPSLEELTDLIAGSQRPVVLTGAGFSVASGLPTYRGPEGLWTLDPEAERLPGPPAPDAPAAEISAYWDRSWAHWGPMRERGRRARPNAAHRSLQSWQADVPDLVVVTQNVDGLDTRAGTTGVHEIHGSLWRNRCSAPDCVQPPWFDREPWTSAPPCPTCGRPARLDAVMFNEALDAPRFHLVKRAVKHADLLLVTGTSGTVTPAADLPWLASDYGVACVRLDPGDWHGRPIPWTLQISATAEAVLPPAVTAAVRRPLSRRPMVGGGRA
jgi:NAD-dependent deacetylase